ncbi:hypothetical protein CCS05_09505 [Levilactobacillus brevis]|nr:hypothetical protein CCS05_09505 [Levilactobacillus brevis]
MMMPEKFERHFYRMATFWLGWALVLPATRMLWLEPNEPLWQGTWRILLVSLGTVSLLTSLVRAKVDK